MALRLRYGSYTHADNSVTVSMDAQRLENDGGGAYLQRETWTVTGRLHGGDTADVKAKFEELERAYLRWGYDLTLETDAGVVVHRLLDGPSVTGTRVVKPPHYPDGTGAQLSTFRDYAIVVTADYPADAGNPLRSFSETVSFSGGGPRRAVVECTNATPQEQVLVAFTAFRATQTGTAVGLLAYPPVPPPLFPGKEEVASVPPGNPQKGSPQHANGRDFNFPISWTYSFVSGVPLIGEPNRWPG